MKNIFVGSFLKCHLALWIRVESGSPCWLTWSNDPLNNPDVTHMLKSLLFISNVKWHRKILTCNNITDFFDLDRIPGKMKHYPSTSCSPWKWNYWTSHASKLVGKVNQFPSKYSIFWFTIGYISARPEVYSLTDYECYILTKMLYSYIY